MSRSEIQRLFGDEFGGSTGNGPRQWNGIDDGQTRKARFCEPCNRHYSVDADECPGCREKRTETRGKEIARRIRADMKNLRGKPGVCKVCFERLGVGRRDYCGEACANAARVEGYRRRRAR